MKLTASDLRQMIQEVTQGEMEFQELEDARRAYIEDRNDDTKHELGLMVNKLVEPIMAELGLFWEAEAYYNRGELVFTNHDDMEVAIDPAGMRGRYEVQVYPLVGADEDFKPVEISLDSMKGVVQFIYDLEDPHGDGMVGEPKAQTELPFGEGGLAREHKTRITKTELQKIIKEELLKETHWLPNEGSYPRELLSNVSKAIDWDVGQAFAFVVDLLEDVNAHDEAKQVNDLLLQGQEQDSPRYETEDERDLAKFQKDRFGKKGNHASAVMADYKSDY